MMKRYDLMVFDENDGTVHANMEEDVDGAYVTRHDAEQAITTAVEAERRRVWEVVTLIYEDAKERVDGRCRDMEFQKIRMDEYEYLIPILFPDGEPKAEEPKPEDTLGEDEIHTCGTCGKRMDIVRPGKWQCPECD